MPSASYPVILCPSLWESSRKCTTGARFTSLRTNLHLCVSNSSLENILLQQEHLSVGELFSAYACSEILELLVWDPASKTQLLLSRWFRKTLFEGLSLYKALRSLNVQKEFFFKNPSKLILIIWEKARKFIGSPLTTVNS